MVGGIALSGEFSPSTDRPRNEDDSWSAMPPISTVLAVAAVRVAEIWIS